jgi:hypothetical protein
MVKESEHQNKDKPDKQMMPVTQMNTHLICPKYFPNTLGVPFLSMVNLPFSKAAGNTKLTTQKTVQYK